MSHYRRKHHRSRSRSRSSIKKRESRPNRNQDRAKGHDRRADSYERNHHSMYSNTQHNYRYPSDLITSIDEIINDTEKHSPMVQTLVRELLLERQRRQLIEGKLNIREHDYALLHARHEQIINNMTLLQRNYDQSRLDLNELNELRCTNHQLRAHIDHRLNDERQQAYASEEMFYSKRQRRQ